MIPSISITPLHVVLEVISPLTGVTGKDETVIYSAETGFKSKDSEEPDSWSLWQAVREIPVIAVRINFFILNEFIGLCISLKKPQNV